MLTPEETQAEEARVAAEHAAAAELAEKAKADAQAEVDAEAAFASGFEMKPTPTEDKVLTPVELKSDSPAETAKVEEIPAEKKVEPKYAQVTEEQLAQILSSVTSVGDIKTAMEKQFGSAFGKMGGIERTIKSLQDATASGQPITVSEDDLAEIKTAFPELTTKLAKDLTKVMSKMKGTGVVVPAPIDPAQIQQVVDERVRNSEAAIEQRVERSIATRELGTMHPDWKEIIGPKDSTTEFRKWLGTQSADYAERIRNSWSPSEISNSISKFKEAKAATTKKPVAQVKSDAELRKERLKEAVNERGGGQSKNTTKTPEEEFAEGFQETMQSR